MAVTAGRFMGQMVEGFGCMRQHMQKTCAQKDAPSKGITKGKPDSCLGTPAQQQGQIAAHQRTAQYGQPSY